MSSCNPAANVAVEALCTLVKGKTLYEAANLPESEIFKFIGGQDEDLQKKVKGLKELLNIGISRHNKQM